MMYHSAGTSGLIHVTILAVSLFGVPALNLAFEEQIGRSQAQDVLEYGEAGDFKSKFSDGALNTALLTEANSDRTESGIDPDSNEDTDSSGDYGFNEPGDAPEEEKSSGDPREVAEEEKIAGGEAQGSAEVLNSGGGGERITPGDTGKEEELEDVPTTREIVIFVNLRPDPESAELPKETVGKPDAPSPYASLTDGDKVERAPALEVAEVPEPGAPQSGDVEGLKTGEADDGRKSERDASLAAARELGAHLPPDAPATFQTEEVGNAPETMPVGEVASLAPTENTVSSTPDETASGTETPLDKTTVAEQAVGQPGLPEQNNEVEAEDRPLPKNIVPQPEMVETVPEKEIAGELAPITPREDRQRLQDPEAAGAPRPELGGNRLGIAEEKEGERGPLNEIVQQAIEVASGNADATESISQTEELREGVRDKGIQDAQETDIAGELAPQVAAVDPGTEFRAQDAGPRDNSALLRDVPEPIAKVVAEIAGDNEELARAIIQGAPIDRKGGNPMFGQARINEILQKAADNGLAKAQTQLAKRYLLGLVDGVTPDEMTELLRNASERGDREAQLLLGVLLAEGKIVPKDSVQSHVLFDLAASTGNENAEEMLPYLERHMQPREVVDSRRLAREYKLFLEATAAPRLYGSEGEGLADKLLDAAAAGNTAKIAELLSRGADLEGEDVSGRTAVINAAWRGEPEVVDLLIGLDADLNVADYEGRTAVSWAASNGHTEIVKKLLAHGGLPGTVDKEGLTPLMRAAWNGHTEVVKALIDAGAPVNDSSDDGKSALDYAMEGEHPEIVRLLRAYGA